MPQHVLLLAGGTSAEHPISLRSAASVLQALTSAGHRTTTVLIARDGSWRVGDSDQLLNSARQAIVEVPENWGRVVNLVWDGGHPGLVAADGTLDLPPLDVAFPLVHGPGGEDGTLQGLLEQMQLPFVGAGTGASALAIDKLTMKVLCRGADLPQVDFLDASSDDADTVGRRIQAGFGFPVFVKPATQGSSFGVSKVAAAADLDLALAEARRYESRVLVERAVDAREIEVAVLGHAPPEFSPPGEIVPPDGFYDFDAKYTSSQARLIVPAQLDAVTLERIHEIAGRAWALIDGRGMVRADFFVEHGTGAVLFNEFNTIPGFTDISMYPRLWQEAGLPIQELVGRLLKLAVA